MSDTISSYLLYGLNPEAPLQRVLEAVLEDDWELVTSHDGDFRYRIGEDRRTTERQETVLSEVDTPRNAAVAVERGDQRVWIEKDTDMLPTVESWNLYFWSDKYEFTHRGQNRSREVARDRVRTYVDLVALAVEATDPSYGFGKFGYVVSPKIVPTVDELMDQRVHSVFWLNVFGPKAIERFGRNRLLDAPAWDVRDLETGHVLVQVLDNPIDPADDFQAAHRELSEYLELDYDPGQQ